MGWFWIIVIVLIVLGAISSQGDKVKKAIESKNAQDSQEKILRERCEAYRDYLLRSQHAHFSGMGPTELFVHVQTAAIRALQARKNLKSANEGLWGIGIAIVVIAFLVGLSDNNAGVAVPVAMLCIGGGIFLSKKLGAELLADDEKIAGEFGLDVNKLRQTVDGLVEINN